LRITNYELGKGKAELGDSEGPPPSDCTRIIHVIPSSARNLLHPHYSRHSEQREESAFPESGKADSSLRSE